MSQVAEPLKFFGARFEELRKRHVEYAEKLERERESSYADLGKTKAKYDATCQEVESKRKKAESHYDKAKAQNAYQQQLFEMHNAKNSYLIAIRVTNKQKEKYYHEYIPEVMDSLQDLNEFRTVKVNALWTVASALEAEMLQTSHGTMTNLGHEITRNQPHLDSMMYMRHNIGGFNEPPDKAFEASPVWHDDDAMVVDQTAQVYLRNVLSKSKTSLGDLRREVDKKRREVESARRLKQRVRDGTEKKDEVDVVRMLFALQEELHATDRQRLTAEVETSTITSAVGDVTQGAKNHNFKSQTFKIPTNCDLCGERIWGLSAKGFDCRDCGYTCHSKCEMKVPPDCPGELGKDERKKLKAQRQDSANQLLKPNAGNASSTNVSEAPDLARSNTMNSLSSHSARRSVSGHLSPMDENAPPEGDAPRPSISSARSGNTVKKNRVMAPPPAAYIGDGSSGAANGGEKEEKKGKMMYQFDGSGEGELTVPEGREVSLVEDDGKLRCFADETWSRLTSVTDGSGWVKVRAGYKEGLVPASYVDFTTPIVPSAPARPASTYSNSTTSSAAASLAAGSALKKKGPAVAPKRGAKKLRYVEALYEYTAQGDTEHSMVEGERFVLVKEDPGDGWVEVEKAGVTASVPATYVQIV